VCHAGKGDLAMPNMMIGIKLTQGSESIEVNGTVRYVSRGLGMGIQFEDQIPARQLAILENWLAMAAKQSA
jgi:hypothetical protein